MRRRCSLQARTAESPLSRSASGGSHLDGLLLSQGRPRSRPLQKATLGPPEAAPHCRCLLLLSRVCDVHTVAAACGCSSDLSQSPAELKRQMPSGPPEQSPNVGRKASRFTGPSGTQDPVATPTPVRSSFRRGLTPRSTRGPTAGQQARAAPRCTMRRAGLPSHRWSRVTSNVRRHERTFRASTHYRNERSSVRSAWKGPCHSASESRQPNLFRRAAPAPYRTPRDGCHL